MRRILIGYAAVLTLAYIYFEVPPLDFIGRSAKSALYAVLQIEEPDPRLEFSQTTALHDSTFIRLKGEHVDVKLTRGGTGGGLTEFRGGVVLLAFEGSMFHATGPSDIAGLSIEAPQNGFEAYKRDMNSKHQDLAHFPGFFRYNDILFIEAGGINAFFASFTRYYSSKDCYVTAIARLDLPPGDVRKAKAIADDWETIYETEPCLPLKSTYRAIEGQNGGGRIAYDGKGKLFLGSGDYALDGMYAPISIAQDDQYEYGKVVEIALDGSGHRITSKGHRNQQGLVWHRDALYAVEHGMRGGDELNKIVAGVNYGWPNVTLGTMYNGRFAPGTADAPGRHDGYEKPLFAWVPSVAISSLHELRDVHPAWNGDLLMGTLASRALIRIRLEGDRLMFEERIPIGDRVRYAQPIPGKIVLWTDRRRLVFLEPTDLIDGDPVEVALTQLNFEEPERSRLYEAFATCTQCHSLVAGDHGNAPSLALIFKRGIGAGAFDAYSEALRARDGTWTRENLIAYVSDPQGFAPGTSMPDTGITDPAIAAGIADVLEKVSEVEPTN